MAEAKKKRRDRGDDGISWDITNKCYVGTISLGNDPTGKGLRRTVTGKTKAQVKNKLDKLHDEIKAGIRSPATYTVEQCVRDWLDSSRSMTRRFPVRRAGREMDLSEDRKGQAQASQRRRPRTVLQ